MCIDTLRLYRLMCLAVILSLLPVRDLRAQRTDSLWLTTMDVFHTDTLVPPADDTLVYRPKNIVKPILESLAINAGVLGYNIVLGREWAKVNLHTIHRNLTHKLVLDNDSYSGNQFSHPYHGGLFYNSARLHGMNYYQAALYPLVGSITWEYLCENNLPAFNDFLSTGIGGTAIGESAFRASDLVFDNSRRGASRVIREIGGSILNPVRGVHRLISGEMFRVSRNRGRMLPREAFDVILGFGNRHMHEMRHEERSKDVPYLEVALIYGDPMKRREHPRPFDYFTAHAVLNLAPNNPTFSDVDIHGRIISKQMEMKNGWGADLGFYQNFRYVDNYGCRHTQRAGDFPLFCEAASFGPGFIVGRRTPRMLFSETLSVNGILFGGVGADYYEPRRYSFAQGFSLRNRVMLLMRERFTVGEDVYFGRFYVHKGGTSPEMEGNYYWGDQGHSSVLYERMYLMVALNNNFQIKMERTLFWRKSSYTYYPGVTAKSYEMMLGLVLAI